MIIEARAIQRAVKTNYPALVMDQLIDSNNTTINEIAQKILGLNESSLDEQGARQYLTDIADFYSSSRTEILNYINSMDFLSKQIVVEVERHETERENDRASTELNSLRRESEVSHQLPPETALQAEEKEPERLEDEESKLCSQKQHQQMRPDETMATQFQALQESTVTTLESDARLDDSIAWREPDPSIQLKITSETTLTQSVPEDRTEQPNFFSDLVDVDVQLELAEGIDHENSQNVFQIKDFIRNDADDELFPSPPQITTSSMETAASLAINSDSHPQESVPTADSEDKAVDYRFGDNSTPPLGIRSSEDLSRTEMDESPQMKKNRSRRSLD